MTAIQLKLLKRHYAWIWLEKLDNAIDFSDKIIPFKIYHKLGDKIIAKLFNAIINNIGGPA